jgi:DNA-binding cell septation regulator SpoVG
VRCLSFELCAKGTLQGYASVETDSGIIFHEVQVHGNGKTTWVLMASKHRHSGPIVQFRNDAIKDRFKLAVVDCVLQFIEDNP